MTNKSKNKTNSTDENLKSSHKFFVSSEKNIYGANATSESADKCTLDIKTIHEHLWKHFDLTAKQRVDLFKYYNIFFTGFAASAYHVFDKSPLFLVLIGIAFFIITLIFQGVEDRCHSLVNLSRDALERFEDNNNLKDSYHIFKKDQKSGQFSKNFKYLFFLGYTSAILAAIYGMLPILCYLRQIPL